MSCTPYQSRWQDDHPIDRQGRVHAPAAENTVNDPAAWMNVAYRINKDASYYKNISAKTLVSDSLGSIEADGTIQEATTPILEGV